MEKIKWYESTTLRALLLAFVSQVIVWTGIAENLPDGAATLLVDGILQVVAIIATAYAAWARANRANPPITEKAAQKVEAMASTPPGKSQAGFTRMSFLSLLVVAGMIALTVPVVVSMQGCAQFGMQQAKSFNENVAYALGQTTALRKAATDSLTFGQLTPDDAEYVLKLTDQSRALIDAAQLAYTGGDVATAEGRLQLVIGVLTQVQSYLNSKGVK